MFEVIEKETGKRLPVYATQGDRFLVDAGDGGFAYRSMDLFAPIGAAKEEQAESCACTFSMVQSEAHELDALLDGITSGQIPVELGSTISTRLRDGTVVDLVVTDFDDSSIRLESRDCLGISTSANDLDSFLDKVYGLLPDALKKRIVETERVHIDSDDEKYTDRRKLFVPAASEIFPPDECYGDEGLYRQLEWYKDVHNRVRAERKEADARWYWTSSPIYSACGNYFCCVYSNGIANRSDASATSGLAPFGCIISKIS